MTANERREQIINILMDSGKVKTGELAKKFQVSTETIRKDLIFLEKEKLIQKNNGSAQLLVEDQASSYARKSQKDVEAKKKIAEYAARLIPENAVIFIDAGSTNYQLALRLIMRKDILVATNFSPVAEVLNANSINTILIGGTLRKVSGATTGAMASQCINQLNADIAFVGTSGFYNSSGPCVENMPEAEVKQQMIKNAKKTYVLADNSKFQTTALFKYADWSEISTLIVDGDADDEQVKKLKKKTEVYIVD